ncbi:hypothetical protein CR513_40831, partial [Mucuna pruriens]
MNGSIKTDKGYKRGQNSYTVYFGRNVKSAQGGPKPIIVQVPTRLHYKDDKVVPWKYDVEVHEKSREDRQLKTITNVVASTIANILGPSPLDDEAFG